MPRSATKPDPNVAVPYRRSWIDVVLAGIDRLPGPTWLFFLVAAVVLVVAGTGIRWLSGALPVGTIRPERIATDLLALYGLATIRYATWVAGRSLDAFRPALGDLAEQEPMIRYRLTTLPQRLAVISLGVAAIVAIVSLSRTPATWDILPSTPPAAIAFFVAEALLTVVFFIAFVFFAYHQLATVIRIHRLATGVSILERSAHSGFSRLTLSTSISVALPIYVAVIVYTVSGKLFWAEFSVVDIVMMIVVLVTAVLVFVAPLSGMHRRLVRAKAVALDAVGRSFQSAAHELRRRIAANDYAGADGVHNAMAGLTLERDTLKRAPTWPWEAETLRRFVSSIAVPLALWVATTLLGKFL